MKRDKLVSLVRHTKRPRLILSLGIPLIVIVVGITFVLFGPYFTRLVHANFASWGDTSLINACLDPRGRIIVVAPGTNCNASESEVTWLKDVNVGTGLTETRSSSGATLSLSNNNIAGWTAAETWTYASATTITVPTDATTRYSIGDKIRLKQGGNYKYFYIIGVAATTLTITGGSDYTLANATITDNDFSKVSTPVGFPQWFGYTPTYTGFSSDPVSREDRFRIEGNTCIVFRRTGSAGTSNAANFHISAPVPAASGPADFWTGGQAMVSDNSANQGDPGRIYIQAGSTIIAVDKSFNNYAWTIGGTKDAEYIFQYEIN